MSIATFLTDNNFCENIVSPLLRMPEYAPYASAQVVEAEFTNPLHQSCTKTRKKKIRFFG